MIRPCFLVIDREYSGSISTRKLVIETAKFNVITAYSAQESLETLALFPHITAIVMDAGIRDIPCCDLVARFKQIQPKLPVIVISDPSRHDCEGADHILQSFDPAKLLALLEGLVPEYTAAINARNMQLSETQQ